MRWKQVICSLVSKYFDMPQLAIQLYKTLDYWSQNMLKFNFSEKGLGLISPSHFFQEKYFSCYILLTDKIHCLIAFTSRDIGLYVFYNCFLTGCDVIKVEINIIFLIKPFWYRTKKSSQKLRYLENEKSFWSEIKTIFHHF